MTALLRQHTEPCFEVGSRRCNLCGLTIRKNQMRRHLRNKHLARRWHYECPACKKVSVTKAGFSAHLLTFHPELKGIELSDFAFRVK